MEQDPNERASRKEMIMGAIFVAVMIALAVYSIVVRGLSPLDTPQTLMQELRQKTEAGK
ncbi:MAG: hypothetical protein ACYTFT_00220 [Planctomycetota bacterium]|jgi:hypothetical protein